MQLYGETLNPQNLFLKKNNKMTKRAYIFLQISFFQQVVRTDEK